MLITPDQIRAARALKNWSQAELAERVDMATPSIGNIESGKHTASSSTQSAIIGVFDTAGIEFIEGGVRHKKFTVQVLSGKDGFADFRADVISEARQAELNVCVNNVDDRQFDKWGAGKVNEDYLSEMLNLKNSQFRILVKENDTHLSGISFAEYRWLPEDSFGEISFYIYADKTAIISFEDDNFNAFVIDHPRVARFYRQEFERLWTKAHKVEKS